jgi:hypothetical protein
LAFLTQNKAKLCKNFDHNTGFLEKRQFFRRKLAKIAENCDHNIDPWPMKGIKIVENVYDAGVVTRDRKIGFRMSVRATSHDIISTYIHTYVHTFVSYKCHAKDYKQIRDNSTT